MEQTMDHIFVNGIEPTSMYLYLIVCFGIVHYDMPI